MKWFPDILCWFGSDILCWFGIHDWSDGPGENCTKCGKHDIFWN